MAVRREGFGCAPTDSTILSSKAWIRRRAYQYGDMVSAVAMGGIAALGGGGEREEEVAINNDGQKLDVADG